MHLSQVVPEGSHRITHTREVRDHLTIEQVLDMIVAIAQIRGEPDYRESILQVALDGLRLPTEMVPRETAGVGDR